MKMNQLSTTAYFIWKDRFGSNFIESDVLAEERWFSQVFFPLSLKLDFLRIFSNKI